MNKTELVAAVAQKAELSKKDAEKAVAAVTAAITDALCAGDQSQCRHAEVLPQLQ